MQGNYASSVFLAYLLTHAAVLANSNVHHYLLTETFDAWESWDIIHNAPERLRWEIWAYSHAAVKTPSSLKMPRGSYISWCNQGKELLSEEDVRFLTDQTNAALKDAAETKKVYGPTLVYCRSAMEWQSENKPSVSIKEWIDEQAGTFMKWSIPVLSITRSEYLPDVKELKEDKPLNISLWELNDGTVRILAGNLEEGINNKDEHKVAITVNLLQQSTGNSFEINDLWHPEKIPVKDHRFDLLLDQAQTKLLTFRK